MAPPRRNGFVFSEFWPHPLPTEAGDAQLAYRLAPLLYERMMVLPEVSSMVWDDAAVEATQSELAPLHIDLPKWWSKHYRPTADAVSEQEMRHRRGGYSSGGFI